jgi:hypothetical protein
VHVRLNTQKWWSRVSDREPSRVQSARVERVRAVAPSDAGPAAAWIIDTFPVPPALAAALPALLARLIAADVLRGELVEHVDGAARRPPVVAAFGLTGFLADRRATAYLAAPYPHLELDLLDEARRGGGNGPFLDHDAVAQANAGDGLAAFPLLWLQRENDPHAAETRVLLAAGQKSFMHMHRGYRLARILKETTADRAGAFLAGGFRERGRLAPGTALRFAGRRLAQEHVVFEASRSDMENALPGAMVSHLFAYQPPRCGFTRSEKQVLERAVDHLTDGEIAAALGITPSAVALRWRSIYVRMAERVPLALDAEPGRRAAARGREKRRRVIAFVDDHPEEMRPYPQP